MPSYRHTVMPRHTQNCARAKDRASASMPLSTGICSTDPCAASAALISSTGTHPTCRTKSRERPGRTKACVTSRVSPFPTSPLQPLAAPAPRPSAGRKPDGKGGRPRLETVRLHACTRPRDEQPRSRHSARASSVIGQLPTRHLGCGHKDRRAGVRVRVGRVGRAGSPCLACSCPCALRAVCRRIWSGCCAC